MPRRVETFPFEAVRDLLGVVRAIYAAGRSGGASRGELVRIARLGKMLGRSLELARSADEASPEMDEAWRLAETATRRVGEIIDVLTPAEPIVMASSDRVFASTKPRKKKEVR